MKRAIAISSLLMMFFLPLYVVADEGFVNPYGEPYKVRCTCYIAYNDNPVTRSGVAPKEGMVAGRYEDLGKTAILYRVDEDGTIGELIGYFDFTDTGSHEGLVNGTRIDIYRDSLSRCYDWVDEFGDYVYIQIVDAQG